ncbi:MAG: hypothetical protein FWD23_14045 [Oscillospiraceae bacterium]|nr:hypothetical protein [Oscillospiraceae bacterium]
MDFKFTPMARRENILMGFHYADFSNCNRVREMKNYPLNIYPYFEDYLEFMESDLLQSSYADFWRWWYILERYKGDELGMGELDKIVDECLKRGIKVKIDPSWNTWWSIDADWETYSNMSVGPQDADDWVHFCELTARRYRGRVSLWDLQGEANNLEFYWLNKPWSHVHEIYRKGFEVFRRLDPKVHIGISGASPSVPVEQMDAWYWGNLEPCAGYYDNVPMNYFAHLADPYKGGVNYYRSLKSMLDRLGLDDVEIGMGETSVQWAESTQLAAIDNLNMRIQTETMNELYGTLFTEGMNKNIMWFTQYAPGGGHWPWCWGMRNYEDWWNIWPAGKKIEGTRIVYRFDAPDGNVYDMRPEWPEPENPYFPSWEIHKFWQQASPRAHESVRAEIVYEGKGIWKLCSWHKTADAFTAVAYVPSKTSAPAIIGVDQAGWNEGEKIKAAVEIKQFDTDNGKWSGHIKKTFDLTVENGRATINIGDAAGFVSIRLVRFEPDMQAEFISVATPEKCEAGSDVKCAVTLRNTGKSIWKAGSVSLTAESAGSVGLSCDAGPGGLCVFEIAFTADNLPGVQSVRLRMAGATGEFGPEAYAHTKVEDTLCPAKLVAHSGINGIYIQWFSPAGDKTPQSYELFRARGYDGEYEPVYTSDKTCWRDTGVGEDTAYYYRVRAHYADGRTSNFSNADNAKKRGKPRFYDAEIVDFSAPPHLRLGQKGEVRVVYRNTGIKSWKSVVLSTTRYFGADDDNKLPAYPIAHDNREVAPGGTVEFSFPVFAPRAGKFENHWVLRMASETKPDKNGDKTTLTSYIGTPLLCETNVIE